MWNGAQRPPSSEFWLLDSQFPYPIRRLQRSRRAPRFFCKPTPTRRVGTSADTGQARSFVPPVLRNLATPPAHQHRERNQSNRQKQARLRSRLDHPE